MKKILAIIMGILVFATPVVAANSFGVDVGALPTHWSYGFKKMGEGLALAFTFRQEAKAKLQYAYALRRMAEVEELDELGEYQYTNQLVERYQYRMEKVQEYIENIEEVTETTTELGAKVQEAAQTQTQVLQRLRSRVPEEARAGIDQAIESTSQIRERIRERLQECDGGCTGVETCQGDCLEGETCDCAQEMNQEQNQGETQNQEQNTEGNGFEGNSSGQQGQ
ncbi:MAG: hypothetical protein KJ906_00995 [Nanoarchaeota archaeon]|nr:hypothetical protein [Nanoarchaeota archaeon]